MLRSVAAAACLLFLLGCPTIEEPAEDDVLWDPPLTSSSGGELDLGAISEGTSEQWTITGTNNTDETLTFDVEVDLEGAEGWVGSASTEPQDVLAGDQIAAGGRFNPSANSPDDSSGTAVFIWDDEIVTYIIRASVDR